MRLNSLDRQNSSTKRIDKCGTARPRQWIEKLRGGPAERSSTLGPGGTPDNSPPLPVAGIGRKKEIRAVGTVEMPDADLQASLREAHFGAQRKDGLVTTRPLYSATASFSITTFKCAVTSLCSFTGTVNSPRVFSGSWSWICFRSRLIPFFTMASAMSPEVTDPNS